MPAVDPLDLLGAFDDYDRPFNPAHFVTLDRLRGWLAHSRRARQQASPPAEPLWRAILADQSAERWRAPIGGGRRGADDSSRGLWWVCLIRNDFAERNALPALSVVLRSVEHGRLPAGDEFDAFTTALADIALVHRKIAPRALTGLRAPACARCPRREKRRTRMRAGPPSLPAGVGPRG